MPFPELHAPRRTHSLCWCQGFYRTHSMSTVIRISSELTPNFAGDPEVGPRTAQIGQAPGGPYSRHSPGRAGGLGSLPGLHLVSPRTGASVTCVLSAVCGVVFVDEGDRVMARVSSYLIMNRWGCLPFLTHRLAGKVSLPPVFPGRS